MDRVMKPPRLLPLGTSFSPHLLLYAVRECTGFWWLNFNLFNHLIQLTDLLFLHYFLLEPVLHPRLYYPPY